MYFGSFPILIRVFCYISIFIILFSNFYILFSIFSGMFSTLFIAFKASSNKILLFPYSFNILLSFRDKFHISLFIIFLIAFGCLSFILNIFYFFLIFPESILTVNGRYSL